MASAARMLDAAGELFAANGVDAVDMKDIARAAGCSRATLYRHFENRAALYTAYVHREARAVAARLAESTAGIAEPRARLLAAMTEALALVRQNPSLSAWFSRTSVGTEAAGASEVVLALTAAFVRSLDTGQPPVPADPEATDRRARWLVRILTSLLISPGRDADDERAMIEEFVLPLFSSVVYGATGPSNRH